MVSGIGNTNKVLIWPSIQVSVFSTDDAVASIAWFTFAAIHGVAEVAKVIAFGVLVAVVCSICAWITWLADLEDTEIKSTGNIFYPSFYPRDLNKTCRIHTCFDQKTFNQKKKKPQTLPKSRSSRSTNYFACSNLI